MKIDAALLFSDAQAVTATAASDSYIPLGAAIDLGAGNQIDVVTVVDVAMTDGSSDSTITVTLETDDASTFGSATTAQTCFVIPALSAVGDTFVTALGSFTTPEAFLRAKYTTTNGNLTTGSFTTFLTTNGRRFRKYAKNYTVSSSNQF